MVGVPSGIFLTVPSQYEKAMLFLLLCLTGWRLLSNFEHLIFLLLRQLVLEFLSQYEKSCTILFSYLMVSRFQNLYTSFTFALFQCLHLCVTPPPWKVYQLKCILL